LLQHYAAYQTFADHFKYKGNTRNDEHFPLQGVQVRAEFRSASGDLVCNAAIVVVNWNNGHENNGANGEDNHGSLSGAMEL